jgi:hypothetical protein
LKIKAMEENGEFEPLRDTLTQLAEIQKIRKQLALNLRERIIIK